MFQFRVLERADWNTAYSPGSSWRAGNLSSCWAESKLVWKQMNPQCLLYTELCSDCMSRLEVRQWMWNIFRQTVSHQNIMEVDGTWPDELKELSDKSPLKSVLTKRHPVQDPFQQLPSDFQQKLSEDGRSGLRVFLALTNVEAFCLELHELLLLKTSHAVPDEGYPPHWE